MPASQTRSVSYRIGEAASGGMGTISQPANQSKSGPGQIRSFGFVGSMSGLPESGHGWAIYEPLLVAVILTDKLRMHRPLRRRGGRSR